MRIGGPHIRPPQWTQWPDRSASRPRKAVIRPPAHLGPQERADPGRVLLRQIVRALAHRVGLGGRGRLGRRIARAIVGPVLGTIGRPMRWIGLLLEALWELLNPIRLLGRGGRARHATGANAPSPRGPSVHVDGENGFLFKPRSDSDGKAVVLMPEKLTGRIEHVVLKSPDGQVIEKGRFSGVANGDRAHFRFSRPGGAYPPGTIVEVRLDDGSTRQWKLTNPALRHD